MWGVSKMLGHTSRVNSSHQNKETWSYKNTSWNEWFLACTERLHSIMNTITMHYLTYNWHNRFPINVPNLVTVKLLSIISQLTINAQDVLHHNQAHTDMSHRGLWHTFRCPRVVVNHLTCIKMCWQSISSFSIGAEYTRAIEVSLRLKIQRTEVGPMWGPCN